MRPTTSRRSLAVAAVASVALLAGCATQPTTSTSTAPASKAPASTSTASAAAPATTSQTSAAPASSSLRPSTTSGATASSPTPPSQEAANVAENVAKAMESLKTYRSVVSLESKMGDRSFTSKTTVTADRSDQDNIKTHSVAEGGEGQSSETITIGNDVWTKMPGQDWVKAEGQPGLPAGPGTTDFAQPVREATSVEKVGDENLDGTQTTKYLLHGESGTGELWIDKDSRIRKMIFTTDLQGNPAHVTTTYSNFNDRVDIKAPK